MRAMVRGSVAGLVATVPMTATMELLYPLLPPEQHYPLPPREITDVLANRSGLGARLSEPDRYGASLALHFAIGTTMGAVYGCLAGRSPLPPPVEGAAYGVAVWAVSYLGGLPVLRILRPATEHPPPRTALMIAAHAVWGAAVGLLLDRLQREDRHASV